MTTAQPTTNTLRPAADNCTSLLEASACGEDRLAPGGSEALLLPELVTELLALGPSVTVAVSVTVFVDGGSAVTTVAVTVRVEVVVEVSVWSETMVCVVVSRGSVVVDVSVWVTVACGSVTVLVEV
jgi:hypothetical protein